MTWFCALFIAANAQIVATLAGMHAVWGNRRVAGALGFLSAGMLFGALVVVAGNG